MKLIANKNTFQSHEAFFREIKENESLLEGVSLETALTKDGIPIIISPYVSDAMNSQIIKSIQSTNLTDIKDYDVYTLDKALITLGNYKNKVVINFIPVSTTPYAQNIELINKVNQQQVDNLYKVLNKYPALNIYLSTLSHNIIFHIKNQKSSNKIGVILTPYETNYIDVDFYIFSPEMLSYPILKQQLGFNKEVMISSRSCEDMMIIYNFFNKFPSIDGAKIFNSTSFISNYPLIFYKLFI